MILTDKVKNEIIIKISEKFTLEKYDIGDFEKFTYPKFLPIMKYSVDKYSVCGLGNMTILQNKTLNLMSLITVVLTPDLSKNIPFAIIDLVTINNKFISFFEFFDSHTNDDEVIQNFKETTLELKKKYENLEDYKEKPNWYVPLRAKYSLLKHGKKDKEDEIVNMLMDYFDEYLIFVSKAKEPIDSTYSKKKLVAFVDDLINKGNPSSEPITKALGENNAKTFFKDIVFYIK